MISLKTNLSTDGSWDAVCCLPVIGVSCQRAQVLPSNMTGIWMRLRTLESCYFLLTYSMQHSPSWEANWFSASQEIPLILWNPKVHCRIHKCPQSVPILSQLDEFRSNQSIGPGQRIPVWKFRNRIRVYSEMLAPRTTPKVDHSLSAVRDCLFNIFADNLHIGGRSSIRNLRTRHAVVTETHLSRICFG